MTPVSNTTLQELHRPEIYVFLSRVMLVQAPWYIVHIRDYEGSSHPVYISVFTIDFLYVNLFSWIQVSYLCNGDYYYTSRFLNNVP